MVLSVKPPVTGAVVLNHNDTENALRLCRALCRCPAVSCVVVADNSAPGRGVENLQEPESFLLPVENRGYAAGNNEGIRCLLGECDVDYVLISNPDVEVACEAVAACVEFLETHRGFAAAAPHMLRADGSQHPLSGWREKTLFCDIVNASGLLTRIFGAGREIYPDEHWQGLFSEVDCLAGSFFLVRSDVLEQTGCFDEGTFLFYEEDILGHRLRQAGYRLAVLNDVQYTHLEGISYDPMPSVMLRRSRLMQKSRLYFQRTCRGVGPLRLLLLRAAGWVGYLGKILRALLILARHGQNNR